MASFAVTFRVDSSGDYSDRYSSMVAQIEKLNTSRSSWDETTSFIIITANTTADDLASSTYTGSDMDGTKDRLLVMKLNSREYATRGAIRYPNLLESLMP